MKREFTSVIEKRGKWYVAYVEEFLESTPRAVLWQRRAVT
jgi:hypothetical protein